MKFTAAIIALAGVVAAAPAGDYVCPVLPAELDISNFHFGGARGPVYTERYSFDVKGNVGPTTAHCQAATGGGSDKCPLAFRNVESTQCQDSGFYFSFLGDDINGFTLEVNYTTIGKCPTSTGKRFFPAADVKCIKDATISTVKYENLTAPTSFTLKV